MSGQQHFHGEVIDEECPHPVIGEAFPHLGAKEGGEAARMPEQIAAHEVARFRRINQP